jgi:lipid-A-disaccharide synthase
VTTEAAMLESPMVIFYRVNPVTYYLGRPLVRTPYFSIVNLVAGERLAPELIQNDMTPERLAAEALRLLADEEARQRMRAGLRHVREALTPREDPFETSAARIEAFLRNEVRS